MAFIQVNGVLHHYLQDGSGEDVVLVHGLACNLAFWYPGVMVALRRKYKVLAYDLRGHGKSNMSLGGYTHCNMAEDLASLADSLGLHSFHLVGHSYGGLIAITYARQHPDRLRSLTLADVPVDQYCLDERNDGFEKYPEIAMLEQLAKNPLRLEGDGKGFAPFHHGKGSQKTAERWLQLLNTTTARKDFTTRRIVLEDLKNVKVPTLLTYGLNSRWRDSADKLKSSLPDNIVVFVQEAGHSHPWEKPGVFLHSWLEFVTLLSNRSSTEKRIDLRYSITFELIVEGIDAPENRTVVETINVSSNGLLIKSATGCKEGDTIRLFLQGSSRNVELKGRVVRCEPHENGYILALDVHEDFEQIKLFNLYLQKVLNTTTPLLLYSA